RALRRLRIPTLVFVNKIDRRGADIARVRAQIAARLSPATPALVTARGVGTRAAAATARDTADPEIDRRGADIARVRAQIAARLSPATPALVTARGVGTRAAAATARDTADP